MNELAAAGIVFTEKGVEFRKWPAKPYVPSGIKKQANKKMTGDQSRLLKPLDRVFWCGNMTDQGTVVETDWAGVSIKWDNGHTTSIQHNDMAQVERVPTNLT
jgi:hypothetical protein